MKNSQLFNLLLSFINKINNHLMEHRILVAQVVSSVLMRFSNTVVIYQTKQSCTGLQSLSNQCESELIA